MSGMWTYHVDEQGRKFYFNSAQNRSVWQLPDGAVAFSLEPFPCIPHASIPMAASDLSKANVLQSSYIPHLSSNVGAATDPAKE